MVGGGGGRFEELNPVLSPVVPLTRSSLHVKRVSPPKDPVVVPLKVCVCVWGGGGRFKKLVPVLSPVVPLTRSSLHVKRVSPPKDPVAVPL